MIRRKLGSAFPRDFRRRLAARMRQLKGDGDIRPAPNTLDRTADRGFGFVVVQTDVGVRDAAFGRNGGRLDRQQRRAGESQVTEVHQMPISHAPVFGRVLAHRRNHDPVAQFQIPNAERLKESGLGHDEC